MLFNILASLSILVAVILLKKMVIIFPSLLACLMRWKESVNLESSVKHSHDRDIFAIAMVIPFCLTAERFRLYDPSFFAGMNENMRIAATAGVFLAYFIIRAIASRLALPHSEKKKTYAAADKAAYTFFIVLTLVLTAMGGILSFIHADMEAVRSAMLWVSAFIYVLFLLRKMQIFVSSFPILTSFLYLCALEIIPTGLLIAPVLIF